jgi:hypothetical protein
MTLNKKVVYFYSIVLAVAFVMATQNVDSILEIGTKEATMSWPYQLLIYGWGSLQTFIMKKSAVK